MKLLILQSLPAFCEVLGLQDHHSKPNSRFAGVALAHRAKSKGAARSSLATFCRTFANAVCIPNCYRDEGREPPDRQDQVKRGVSIDVLKSPGSCPYRHYDLVN